LTGPAPVRVYVALGSNLGERAAYLAAARAALGALPGTRLVASSSIEETEPLGDSEQPPYLNQMLLLETTMPPRDLLHAGQAIEEANGRVRPRTGDRERSTST
jgi:2-amino-4-hydroxy-6-hydroxymethyldihydropteridine diphosphokinase